MSEWFWKSVVADGMKVPDSRTLDDLTSDLAEMLASPDPEVRDEMAYRVLATWVSDGVYDHVLGRLGNGVCGLMEEGVGRFTDDGVFQRSFAALTMAEIIERDNRMDLLPARTVRGWGDRVANWWLAEKDLRGFVPGKGWAFALAHGADAITALARSPKIGRNGLGYLVELIADRLLVPTPDFFIAGEPDRIAAAVMAILHRDVVVLEDLEAWLTRLADRAMPVDTDAMHPYRVNGNIQNFLRALHLQLALTTERPPIRADLMLALVDVLRRTNPHILRPL